MKDLTDKRCIFDETPLVKNEQTGDFDCPTCKAAHYILPGAGDEGEDVLATRPRRVRMKKMPEPGDLYSDVIEPID